MSDFNRRIAIITPFYTPAKLSGSSLLNKQIAELLKENGFQVTVITSNAYWVRYWKDLLFNRTIKPKDIEENGIRIIRLKHHHLISSITYLLSHYLNFILPKQVRAKFEIMHYGPFLDQKELILFKFFPTLKKKISQNSLKLIKTKLKYFPPPLK